MCFGDSFDAETVKVRHRTTLTSNLARAKCYPLSATSTIELNYESQSLTFQLVYLGSYVSTDSVHYNQLRDSIHTLCFNRVCL